MFPPPLRTAGSNPLSSAMPWVWTTGMVAVAFALRSAMEPLLGGGPSFAVFYPAVILPAYAFGRAPAIAATVVSSAIGFWCFIEPAYAWKSTPDSIASLLFFVITCAVMITVITGATRALRQLSGELGRAQAVADNHAALFRELNVRMSHQMRLVAGVLALQAKGEPEPQVAESLRRAMERSLLISRVHRDLGGQGEQTVDFDAFAAALARAICLEREQPADRIEIEPSGLRLSVEDTTSLAVALAECLGALFDAGVSGRMRLRVDARGRQAEVAIMEAGENAEGTLVSVSNGYLLRAMIEQLGAGLALRADARGSALVVSMPRSGAGAAADPGSAATLH